MPRAEGGRAQDTEPREPDDTAGAAECEHLPLALSREGDTFERASRHRQDLTNSNPEERGARGVNRRPRQGNLVGSRLLTRRSPRERGSLHPAYTGSRRSNPGTGAGGRESSDGSSRLAAGTSVDAKIRGDDPRTSPLMRDACARSYKRPCLLGKVGGVATSRARSSPGSTRRGWCTKSGLRVSVIRPPD